MKYIILFCLLLFSAQSFAKINESTPTVEDDSISIDISEINGSPIKYLTETDKFIIAAENGNLAKVKEFVEKKGMDVNAVTVNAVTVPRLTALMQASYNLQLDVVKYLVENGADINTVDNYNGFTALIYAAYIPLYGEGTDKVRYLLKNPDNIKYSNIDIVKYLVQNGADLNAEAFYGLTSLMWASYYGNIDIVKYLVANGANVNFKSYNNRTALMWASAKGRLSIVKYLVENGANVNVKDEINETALIEASKGNYTDVMKYLVKNGATLNAKDVLGITALMYPGIRSNLSLVKYLKQEAAEFRRKKTCQATF